MRKTIGTGPVMIFQQNFHTKNIFRDQKKYMTGIFNRCGIHKTSFSRRNNDDPDHRRPFYKPFLPITQKLGCITSCASTPNAASMYYVQHFGEHGHVSWHRGVSRVQEKPYFRPRASMTLRAPARSISRVYLRSFKQERRRFCTAFFLGIVRISGSLKNRTSPCDDILRP